MFRKIKQLLYKFNSNTKINYFLCGLLVIIYGIAFYWKFERTVIPAQTGWFHYMAWRMSEGDLPYKDFYAFLPPYFIMLTSFLFKLFGKHFILYTIVGFIITKILVWIMLYKMLASVFKPLYVSIGMITGISITAAYLMDQVYDCNPLITAGVVAIAYLFFKMNRSVTRKKYIMVFAVGVLCGGMIMIKQTVAIVCPVISLCFILLIFWKNEQNLRLCINGVLFWGSGLVIAIAPGIIYLCGNHIWEEFIWCISSALEAKIVNTGLLQLCFKNFLRLNEMICALGIVVCYLVCKKYNLRKYSIAVLSSILLLILLLWREFGQNINNFRVGTGYDFTKYVALFLMGLIILCIIDYALNRVDNSKVYFLSIVTMGFIVIICFIDKLITPYSADFLYSGIDFSGFKGKLLYIGIYIVIFIWLQSAYRYFFLKDEKVEKVFAPFTILLLYVGCLFASFSLEELYAVLFIPISVAYLLDFVLSNRMTKYAASIICFIVCFLCLNQKIYVPYSWHGWQSSSLVQNDSLDYSDIEGLEGYILSEKDEKTYANIISLILENSSNEDVLFQFSNIPLFNVLAERKSLYVPILYFDVCSDSIANSVADTLAKDEPMLILFHEMEEWRWAVHESVFRNSERCGQRNILNFYNNFVKANYRLLGKFDNNMGENICLWKKTIFNGGYVDQSIKVGGKKIVSQKLKFDGSKFSKLAIQRVQEEDLTDVKLKLTLKNLSTNEIVIDDIYILDKTEGDYYICELGEHIVNEEDLYELSIMCIDNKSHNFGFSSTREGVYYATIDGKRINMSLGVTID